jgi:hypothetical protein
MAITYGGDGSLGCPHKEEAKNKISAALVGREFSEEHRRRIGDANRKRIWKKESIDKIRISRLGSRLSSDTKRKVSLSLMGNDRALGNRFRHTKETKERMHQAKLLYWRKNGGDATANGTPNKVA